MSTIPLYNGPRNEAMTIEGKTIMAKYKLVSHYSLVKNKENVVKDDYEGIFHDFESVAKVFASKVKDLTAKACAAIDYSLLSAYASVETIETDGSPVVAFPHEFSLEMCSEAESRYESKVD